MHHEHGTRDLAAALSAVERGLALVAEGSDVRSRHLADAFHRRWDRVRRKLARRPEVS
jgi:hypothetical protein